MKSISTLKWLALSLISLSLVACSSWFEKEDGPDRFPPNVTNVPDAVPRYEPIRPANQKSYVVLGKRYYPLPTSKGYSERGIASWYGKKFHGNPTATGERYDMYKMTAAHKTLPLPSYVEVTNLNNGRKIVVRVNDRGPFHSGRIIDLSYSAAAKLGIIGNGTGQVEVRAVGTGYTASTAHNTMQVVENTVEQKGPAKLYLQVGTFSTSSRAEQFKNNLAGKIKDEVLIMPFSQPEGRLYRVRVGPLVTVEYGDNLATRLMDLGFSDTHIVVE